MKTIIWKKRGLFFIIIFLGCAIGYVVYSNPTSISQEKVSKENQVIDTDSTPEPTKVVVYVCGAVCKPGVYHLKENARIQDAIQKAGGFRKNADKLSLNLAEKVKDGQQIKIESKNATENSAGNDGKVNINKATREELMTLSGVGQSRADAIIQYRTKQGSFTSIEDIMKISGIKKGLFEKIQSLITV